MLVARTPIARRSTVPLGAKNFHSDWVGVDGAMLRLGGKVHEGACRKASVVLGLEGSPNSHQGALVPTHRDLGPEGGV